MRAEGHLGQVMSMTGFGQGAVERDGVRVHLELKGVNHRFLDVKMRLPGEVGLLEPVLRTMIQERVSRARIDIAVAIVSSRPASSQVVINRGLVSEYLKAVDTLKTEFRLKGAVGVDSILTLPGAVVIQAEAAPPDGVAAALLTEALRLALDESRLAQEVALLAGRVDITEELVRLQGYVAQAEETLSRPRGPIGKTLDFIMQEMNREANTISSKAETLPICQGALVIKAEVEKVREQVQNIE